MSKIDESVNKQVPEAADAIVSGARLVMANVGGLHQDLLAAFASGQEAITLDLTGLEEGDFSLIQLLLAAQKQARQEGRAFRVILPEAGEGAEPDLAPDHPSNLLPNLLQRAGLAAGSPDAAFCSHGVFNA